MSNRILKSNILQGGQNYRETHLPMFIEFLQAKSMVIHVIGKLQTQNLQLVQAGHADLSCWQTKPAWFESVVHALLQ